MSQWSLVTNFFPYPRSRDDIFEEFDRLVCSEDRNVLQSNRKFKCSYYVLELIESRVDVQQISSLQCQLDSSTKVLGFEGWDIKKVMKHQSITLRYGFFFFFFFGTSWLGINMTKIPIFFVVSSISLFFPSLVLLFLNEITLFTFL